MAYFLTADGGTESLRASVYDAQGQCLGTHAAAYETRFTPGRAEQNPADWWRSFVEASRAAIAEAGVHPGDIVSIAYATTSCTVVALDGHGDALRPAILWMDVRADEEAAMLLATADSALELNGAGKGPVSAEWMIPKALWLKRHEPDVYDRATRICEYQDYLTFKLTGTWAASLDNVGLRWHYRSRSEKWPLGLLKKLDMEELAEKWPPRVVVPGEVVDTLCDSAARALGLSPSVKVVQGGADALIGMIGLGVHRPGQLAMITGSSHLQFGVSETPIHAPGVWGSYADIVYPDRWIIEGGQTSTGSIIQWFARLTGGPLDFADLNARAGELPPGSDGLIVQDHFQGNRTPHTDAGSRGAITGLTLAHGPHHLFRAIIEGICFGTRAILETFRVAGYESAELTVGGGAVASDLWLQIHADTAGIPVRVPDSANAPSMGSAVLAAVGAGAHAGIDEGIAAMIRPGRLIEPNPESMAAYDRIFPQYQALYPALRDIGRNS